MCKGFCEFMGRLRLVKQTLCSSWPGLPHEVGTTSKKYGHYRGINVVLYFLCELVSTVYIFLDRHGKLSFKVT